MSNKNAYSKLLYMSNIEFIDSLKTKCVVCGETRPYVLQFHHRNPKDKKFNVSVCGTRSKQAILDECNKCVCLCANCHAEFHYLYGKVPDEPEEALNEYLNMK